MFPIPAVLNPLAPYKTLIIGGMILVAALGLYLRGRSDGADEVQARWDKDTVQIMALTNTLNAKHRKTEQDAVNLAASIQSGGQNAAKAIYDWYAKHPNVVYRDGKPYRVQSTCPSLPPGAVPEAPTSAGNNQTASANDGYATTGATEAVQIIEPDLLPRCAVTTTMFLSCREYVMGLNPIYNKE